MKRERLQQDLESINSLQITIWLTFRHHGTSKSSQLHWLQTFYPYCVNKLANENILRYIWTRLTLSTVIKTLAQAHLTTAFWRILTATDEIQEESTLQSCLKHLYPNGSNFTHRRWPACSRHFRHGNLRYRRTQQGWRRISHRTRTRD